MNQVEIWLSTLVRKLLKRGNFLSLDDLPDQILAFIAYYNHTMAKPISGRTRGLLNHGTISPSMYKKRVLTFNGSTPSVHHGRSASLVLPSLCRVWPVGTGHRYSQALFHRLVRINGASIHLQRGAGPLQPGI
jgi:hypothetical protein